MALSLAIYDVMVCGNYLFKSDGLMTLVPMWETIKVLTAVADQMDKNSSQTAVGLSSLAIIALSPVNSFVYNELTII